MLIADLNAVESVLGMFDCGGRRVKVESAGGREIHSSAREATKFATTDVRQDARWRAAKRPMLQVGKKRGFNLVLGGCPGVLLR